MLHQGKAVELLKCPMVKSGPVGLHGCVQHHHACLMLKYDSEGCHDDRWQRSKPSKVQSEPVCHKPGGCNIQDEDHLWVRTFRMDGKRKMSPGQLQAHRYTPGSVLGHVPEQGALVAPFHKLLQHRHGIFWWSYPGEEQRGTWDAATGKISTCGAACTNVSSSSSESSMVRSQSAQ